jgi:hypothetical protein
LERSHCALARARMGSRCAARASRRTCRLRPGRRTLGRTVVVAAGVAHGVPGNRHRAHLSHRRFAHGRGDWPLLTRAALFRFAALVDVPDRHRACLGLRLVERFTAARRTRGDNGNCGACRASLRARDLFVERAGNRRGRHRIPTPAERRHSVVCPVVFVRGRDLCLRRALGTLDRSTSRPAATRARSAYPNARYAAWDVAAWRSRFLKVFAVRGRGELRDRPVR